MFRYRDPGAARAEKELLSREDVNYPSVEKNIQGAITQFHETMAGGSVGWSGNTITFDGTWIIYCCEVCLMYNEEWAPVEIRLRNAANATNTLLASGPVGPLRHLIWTGRMILSGSWIIQAVRYNNGTPNQGNFYVIAEKVRD